MRIIAVVPAYNEAKTIADVVKNTAPFVHEVLVINDGSKDDTERLAQSAGARVVSHPINRGLGAALGTGFEAARRLDADLVVTLDGDGQHDAAEIVAFAKAVESGADLVIGSRSEDQKKIPINRRLGQIAGDVLTFVLFGAWVSDSQSGYRALSRNALAKMKVRTNRMEISSEIIAEAKRRKLTIVEIPIKAIYTEYSLSKGQGLVEGLKTAWKLFLRRIAG